MSESRGGLSFRQAVIGALVLFIFFFVLFFGASARQRVTIDTRPVLDSPGKRKGGDLDDRKKKEENLKRDPRKSNSKRSSAKEDESSTTLLDQDYSSVLPDSILKHLSAKVRKRFENRFVEGRCNFNRIAQYRAQGRARFNVTTIKPVVWTCTGRDCTQGLGDQFRGISSAFYQGLAVGFDMMANWSWPIPTIPAIVRPRNTTLWESTEEAATHFFQANAPVLKIGWTKKMSGTLCSWRNHAAVEFRSVHNYKPDGPKDCDFNRFRIKDHVKQTSWSKSGIGCAFWHQFRIGTALEQALASALHQFDAWKKANNRMQFPVVGVHVRGGDKHFGEKNQSRVGIENPFVSRVRKILNTSMVKELVGCARETEQHLKLKNATYFILADNNDAKAEASRLFPGRVYASPAVPIHSGVIALNRTGAARAEAYSAQDRAQHIGVWVDLLMAALCDVIVVSPSPNAGFLHSTFSLVASEIGMYNTRTNLVDGRKCLDTKLQKKGFRCRRGNYNC